jgi:hypothetical protein
MLRRRSCIRSASFVGSLAAGLGHAKSDVDVFAFCDQDHTHPLDVFEEGSWRVDVETYPVQQLDALADPLAAFTGRADDIMTIATLHKSQWDMTARLLNARDMFLDDGGSIALARLRSLEGVFRQAWIHVRVWEMLGSLEDLWGFHADGDAETCRLWGSEMTLQSLEALCVATGHHYLGRKWLAANLRRLDAAQMLHRVWADSSTPTIARAVQGILGAAQLVSDDSTQFVDWRVLTPCTIESPDGPVRNWRYVPWATAEGYRLIDVSRRGRSGSEYSLSAKQVAVWLSCDGAPITSVAETYSAAHGEDRNAVRRQLARLSELGLLSND